MNVKKTLAVWLVLFLVAFGCSAEEKGSSVVTDPAKAGPDYAIQGEYLGKTEDGAKLGAEVVARGDGKFLVNLLPGGLRGEGGDYAKRSEGMARTEDGKVTVTGKNGKWHASIADSKMVGQTPEGKSFTLSRTIRKSATLGKKPPAGAVVLFDGSSSAGWSNGKLVDGHLLGNDTSSEKTFKDHTLHLEFRLSFMPKARGQGRSNSGVYLQHRYEVQVLDSFGLAGKNNECGGLYSKAAPRVNMCYPPLTWQTYDIEFQAARFDKDGKKTANAVITVRHNGVLIHDKLELAGSLPGGQPEKDTPGPLFLQGHGGQVQYRNIWVLEGTSKSPARRSP
jgi:hypothetical protein